MATRTGFHTHHDIPGICTFGPTPVPGLHYYDSTTLTAGNLRAILEPDHTYCVHFHSIRTIVPGWQLEEHISETPDGQPVYVNLTHPVAEDAPQRTQDLWMLMVDARTGAVTADDGSERDVWELSHLTGDDPAVHQGQDTGQDTGQETNTHQQFLADSVARAALARRRTERTFSDNAALAQAMPIVANAVTTAMAEAPDGSPEDRAAQAHGRAAETLDRAYGLARIARAGINIRLHPQVRSYQFFYNQGFPPPTHQDMADHIIRTLSPSLSHRIARTLRRLLGRKDSPIAGLHPAPVQTV